MKTAYASNSMINMSQITNHVTVCDIMEVSPCLSVSFDAWLGYEPSEFHASDHMMCTYIEIPCFSEDDREVVMSLVDMVFRIIYAYYRTKTKIKNLVIRMDHILPGYPSIKGREEILTRAIHYLVAQLQPNILVTWNE